MRLHFSGHPAAEVGLTLELQLIDLETLRPAPSGPSILSHLESDPEFREGLFQSVLQIETGLFPSVAEADRELRRLVSQAGLVCRHHGMALMSAGTHPTVGWRDLHLTSSPRTLRFIKRLQWVGRRAAVFGLKVNVGIPDGEKAIVVGNSLASLVPYFVALSASSPFWRGFDTGLASCRARVVENIPNAGLPPNLLNFGEFQSYVKTLRAAEAIESIADIWWDVRPNIRRGTIEVQACDMPQTLSETMGIAALVQAVVVYVLKNYDCGATIPHNDTWINRENKWRATRFGTDAQLVSGVENQLSDFKVLFVRLRDRIREVVEELGTGGYLDTLEQRIEGGAGYSRQRLAAEQGGISCVPAFLIDEFARDFPLEP